MPSIFPKSELKFHPIGCNWFFLSKTSKEMVAYRCFLNQPYCNFHMMQELKSNFFCSSDKIKMCHTQNVFYKNDGIHQITHFTMHQSI